ncbi:hypothetical protein ILYODFUR_030656 [Ilyodon furcidens]|uniref:Uncharacterized protein n=1 Tax=Ilyodon furcidens TaxID=33524 RepID=A0ABV0U9V3_9TELE
MDLIVAHRVLPDVSHPRFTKTPRWSFFQSQFERTWRDQWLINLTGKEMDSWNPSGSLGFLKVLQSLFGCFFQNNEENGATDGWMASTKHPLLSADLHSG